MSEKEFNKMSASEKKKEDWMNSKWRPMMGWTYMSTCIADFIVFPILWSALLAILKQPVTPWNPLTLQGAGLFHVAMGAVLGIAAFGRTQEKMAGANNGGIQATPLVTATQTSNSFTPAASSISSFTPAAPVNTAPQVITGFGGKKAPMPAEEPAI